VRLDKEWAVEARRAKTARMTSGRRKWGRGAEWLRRDVVEDEKRRLIVGQR
jgi:hypothetical protein